MTDDEIERALRRYAPAAPPVSARARVFSPAERPRDRWLCIAAAAMFVVAVGVHALASQTIDGFVERADATVGIAVDAGPDIERLTRAVGGDVQLREALAARLARDDRAAADRAVVEATWIH